MNTPDGTDGFDPIPEFPDDLVAAIQSLFGEPQPTKRSYNELFPEDGVSPEQMPENK